MLFVRDGFSLDVALSNGVNSTRLRTVREAWRGLRFATCINNRIWALHAYYGPAYEVGMRLLREYTIVYVWYMHTVNALR